MSYEILRTAEGLSIIHITTASFCSFSGWRVEFHNGKEAMLYNVGGEWNQHDEQWLDGMTLQAIGNCIDNRLMERKSRITDSYFYDLLVN